MSDDIRESSGSFMRRHVEPYVAQTIKDCVKEHTEATQTMHTQTREQMKQMAEAQTQLKDMLIGKIPPDPNNPSVWQSLQELIGWKKGVNKVLWIAVTSAIGAVIGTLWMLIRNSGGMQ